MTKAETARQAAIERVGDAYVYGAWDQECTVANRRRYANLSPEYESAIENQCQRMSKGKSTCDGCRWQGHRIHDCRGLTSACAGAAGIAIKGQTVARQWAEDVWAVKGEIGDLPKDVKYAQLFRHNGSKWAHTGCYIGNGETVDARGHAYGVIRRKLSEYKWTHFAVPKGMEEEPGGGGHEVIYQAEVTTESGRLNVRSGPGTSYPKIGSLPMGEVVDVLMDYGAWAYIGGEGLQGYVSTAYLTRIDEPKTPADEPENKGEDLPKPEARICAVLVPGMTRSEAEALAKLYPGAVVAEYKPPDGGEE